MARIKLDLHAIYNNKTQVQIEVDEKHRNGPSVTTTISIKQVEGAD